MMQLFDVQVILWGELLNEPLWGKILIKCSHLLLSVSSALNIVIYSYKVSYNIMQGHLKHIPFIIIWISG